MKVFKTENQKTVEQIISNNKPIFQQKVEGAQFNWGDASKIIKDGEEYFYILIAHSSSSTVQLENNGISIPVFFSNNHPDCIAPVSTEITNSNSTSVSVSWSGTAASRTGIRYILKMLHVKPDGSYGGTKEYWIFEGNSFTTYDVGEAGTYHFELKRICDGEDTDYKLSSEWVSVGSTVYTDSNQAETVCSALQSFSIVYVNGVYVMVEWSGPAAQQTGVRYIIRYRELGNTGDWTEQYVFSGNTYTLLLSGNTIYEIELKLIDGGSGFNYTEECPWISAGTATTVSCEISENPPPGCYNPPPEVPEETPEIVLPEFTCGQDPTSSPASGGSSLSSAQVGDIFYIGGLPILLKEVSGANGTFSGKGLVPLPFGGKVVWVEFNNVQVNAQSEIYQGQVDGVSGGLTNLPNLNSITSGEICAEIPEEQPFSPNGFNDDDQYVLHPPYSGWSPTDSIDTNYDPNGFDADGIHIETGTTFNPSGCSQGGTDAQGQPCTFDNGPYYWLNETPTTPEGVAFSGEVESNLKSLVENALQTIHQAVLDSINLQSTECQGIRTEMETLLQTLGHERVRVFGANDKYFNEGMSRYFTSAPQPILGMDGRDVNQVDFETKHINLYHCDVSLSEFSHLDSILIDEKTNPKVDASVADLLNLIKGLSAEDVALYQGDPTAFAAWILSQMNSKITVTYTQLYGVNEIEDNNTRWANTNIKEKASNSFFFANERINPSSFTASSNPNFMAGNKELSPEDILFQYRQGWEYIGNVHRAYYLDAIIKQRKFKPTTVTDVPPGSLLPIEFTKTIAGREHTIILDNIHFTPLGATVDAYMVLEIPVSGDKIVFRALNIPFGATGVQGASTLYMVSDAEIRLNNAARLTLKGTPNTFVSWDCDGFAGMGIEAEIEFCRKYLIPLDEPSLEVLPDPEMVKGYFITTMPTWGEVIVDIDMDPFAISKYEDIKWQIHDAKLDFSDVQNPSGMVFPPDYQSPFVVNGVPGPLWKGFYLGELSVTLPRALAGGNTGTPVTVSVQHIIIDDMGVSGEFSVSPIIPLNEGDLNGWAYSLDTFSIEVMANQVKEAGFSGLVHIPIARSANNNTGTVQPEDCLQYTAIIQPDNEYLFSIAPVGDDYYVDMWKAAVHFDNTSFIDISYSGGEFLTAAHLGGVIDMDGDFGSGKTAKIEGINFQNVVLANKAPYFKTGFWSFPDIENKLAGFDFSLNDIALSGNSAGDEINMNFDILLGLTKSDIGVTAEGGFTLKGELEVTNGRQKWKYKSFNINTLNINASFPGVNSVQGILSFYEDHPTYGNGFRGAVGVDIKGIEVSVEAVAQFGKMPLPSNPSENYKYFFIDMMANFENGIPMGGLQLKGIGGGVYYHMNRPANSNVGLPPDPTANIPIPSGLGQSLSGIVYTPDHTKGLGLKASVALATKKSEVFNANATFEILFNDGSGVSDIWFYGNFRVMEDIQVTAPPTYQESGGKPDNNAGISGFVDIHFNFEVKTLDASFEIYANVANGLIRGSGANNKFGWGELHFGPEDWYINIGKPDNRNGLKVTVGGLDLITLSTYLDIGTDIPTMPPLPSNVSQLTGAGDFMANESTRATGNGFAFGASVELNTGELEFLIFYAQFQAGIGFDLMLQDYGDAHCVSTNKPIGINGYYASGQAYAYVQGEIGVKVRLFGKNKKFEILSIGAAAVLQAKLPNPFWAKGSVGGYYSVCGGLVKGSCSFNITIGESCVIAGGTDPASDITVIMSATPMEDATAVSTIYKPTVTFNVPVETSFEMGSLSGGEISYHVDLEYARLIHNGTNLLGEIKYNDDKTFLEFIPFDMLPANDSLTFEIKVTIKNGNEIVNTEERSITFHTSEGLDYIPSDNIAASYPMDGQFNFYKEEYSAQKGYVQLNLGQPDLFGQSSSPSNSSTLTPKVSLLASFPGGESSNNTGSNPNGLKAVLYHDGQEVDRFPATYIEASKKIEFELPASAMGNKQLYRLEIKYMATGESNDPLFTTYFRTSEYNDLKEKINAFSANMQVAGTTYLKIKSPIEPFDFLERKGMNDVEPLVQFRGDLNGNSWYNNTVYPLIYQHFPTSTPYQIYMPRDEEVLGTPPVKAVGYVALTSSFVTQEHYETNTYPLAWEVAVFKDAIDYKVPRVMSDDLKGIKDQVDFYALELIQDFDGSPESPAGIADVLADYYVNVYEHDPTLTMPSGTYKIIITYKLPGTDTVTTYKVLNFTKD